MHEHGRTRLHAVTGRMRPTPPDLSWRREVQDRTQRRVAELRERPRRRRKQLVLALVSLAGAAVVCGLATPSAALAAIAWATAEALALLAGLALIWALVRVTDEVTRDERRAGNR